LGPGPTRRELGLVADILRGTDAEDRLAVAGSGSHAWQDLVATATTAGSSGLVALDLITAVTAGVEALVRDAAEEDERT